MDQAEPGAKKQVEHYHLQVPTKSMVCQPAQPSEVDGVACAATTHLQRVVRSLLKAREGLSQVTQLVGDLEIEASILICRRTRMIQIRRSILCKIEPKSDRFYRIKSSNLDFNLFVLLYLTVLNIYLLVI